MAGYGQAKLARKSRSATSGASAGSEKALRPRRLPYSPNHPCSDRNFAQKKVDNNLDEANQSPTLGSATNGLPGRWCDAVGMSSGGRAAFVRIQFIAR